MPSRYPAMMLPPPPPLAPPRRWCFKGKAGCSSSLQVLGQQEPWEGWCQVPQEQYQACQVLEGCQVSCVPAQTWVWFISWKGPWS